MRQEYEIGIYAYIKLNSETYYGLLYLVDVKPSRFYRHKTQWCFKFEKNDLSGIGGAGYTIQEALEDAKQNLIEYSNSSCRCL